MFWWTHTFGEIIYVLPVVDCVVHTVKYTHRQNQSLPCAIPLIIIINSLACTWRLMVNVLNTSLRLLSKSDKPTTLSTCSFVCY